MSNSRKFLSFYTKVYLTFLGIVWQVEWNHSLQLTHSNTNRWIQRWGSLYSAGGLVTLEYSVWGVLLLQGTIYSMTVHSDKPYLYHSCISMSVEICSHHEWIEIFGTPILKVIRSFELLKWTRWTQKVIFTGVWLY